MGEKPTAEQLYKEQQKELEEKAEAQVKKATPVVYAILKAVVDAMPPIEVKSREQMNADYEAVITEVLKTLKVSGLTIQEIEYVMPKLEQVVGVVKQKVLTSLNISSEKVMEKLSGKPWKEMTLDDWDNILLAKEE